jgi:hypothetical protein
MEALISVPTIVGVGLLATAGYYFSKTRKNSAASRNSFYKTGQDTFKKTKKSTSYYTAHSPYKTNHDTFDKQKKSTKNSTSSRFTNRSKKSKSKSSTKS